MTSIQRETDHIHVTIPMIGQQHIRGQCKSREHLDGCAKKLRTTGFQVMVKSNNISY